MIHIVICDDDINHLKNTFEFVENHLKFSPYADLEFRVEITTNPAEIETLSELAPPDILILDIHMPNVDGFEIAETFNLCKAKTKIIFLSNYEECSLLSSDDYQKKVAFAVFRGIMNYKDEKTS